MTARVVAQEVTAAVLALERRYGNALLPELPAVIDSLDRLLPRYLEERIALNCTALVAGSKHLPKLGPTFFQAHGQYFQVMAGETVSTPGELELVLALRDFPGATRVVPRGEVQIKTPGRYRTVVIQAEPSLEVRTEDLQVLVSALAEAAYRWLTQLVEKLVKRGESDLTRDLYGLFRATCTSDELRRAFVFGAVSKRHVIYLIDSESAAHALAMASRTTEITFDSPARVLAEILNAAVPYDVSLSKPVIEGRKTRVMNFHRARYTEAVGPTLSRAEAVAIGTVAVAIRPITHTSEEVLLAVAPAAARDQLDETIDAIESQLAERFTVNRGLLNSIYERLKQHAFGSTVTGDVAELAGRFTGGVLHSHP